MCFLSACCWPFVEYDLEEPPRRKVRKTYAAVVSNRVDFPKPSSSGSQPCDNNNFLHLPTTHLHLTHTLLSISLHTQNPLKCRLTKSGLRHSSRSKRILS